MIGAAAMGKLIMEGTPAYFLHVSPVKEPEECSETLRGAQEQGKEEEKELLDEEKERVGWRTPPSWSGKNVSLLVLSPARVFCWPVLTNNCIMQLMVM